jgi:hypothetical protein
MHHYKAVLTLGTLQITTSTVVLFEKLRVTQVRNFLNLTENVHQYDVKQNKPLVFIQYTFVTYFSKTYFNIILYKTP